MTDDSRALIESASSGDSFAIDSLIERYLPGLRAFVRLRAGRVLRAKESESDLVQSACREVLQKMGTFQYRSEARFKQWLYRTAERKIVDRARYYKAQKRDAAKEVRPNLEGSSAHDAQLLDFYRNFSTPSRAVIAKEDLQRIESAFDRLPEDYRDVITLSRIVGLSHKQIAEEMDRSEGAVRMLLYRALAELSDLLAAE